MNSFIEGPVSKSRSPELVTELMLKVRFWEDSLAGPAVIPVAKLLMNCAPASSSTVGGFPPKEKPGASFIAEIVMAKN